MFTYKCGMSFAAGRWHETPYYPH